MHRSTGLVRALWQITILLQLMVPTFVSIADARPERDTLTARGQSHIEAQTGKDCARAHKADCALCQHLTTPLTKAAKLAAPAFADGRECPAVAACVTQLAAWSHRPSLPRAPPTS
jgi:hypothetical protein